MKKIIKIALPLVLIIISNVSFGQGKRQEKADKLYQNYAYVDAIKIYERIAEKGFVNQSILQNLGNSYYFNADYKNALKWYDELFKLAKIDDKVKLSLEYYYRYAQSLKSQEKYEQANQVLEQFTQMASAIIERNYWKEIRIISKK